MMTVAQGQWRSNWSHPLTFAQSYIWVASYKLLREAFNKTRDKIVRIIFGTGQLSEEISKRIGEKCLVEIL